MHAAPRIYRAVAEGHGIWRDVEFAVSRNDSARQEQVFCAALQRPAGNINLEHVWIGQLDVFFVLVAGDRIKIDRTEINCYACRLGVGNAGILVITGIVDAVIFEQVAAPDRQIIGLYPFEVAVPSA